MVAEMILNGLGASGWNRTTDVKDSGLQPDVAYQQLATDASSRWIVGSLCPPFSRGIPDVVGALPRPGTLPNQCVSSVPHTNNQKGVPDTNQQLRYPSAPEVELRPLKGGPAHPHLVQQTGQKARE